MCVNESERERERERERDGMADYLSSVTDPRLRKKLTR